MLIQTLRVTFDILRLRAGPQDLPSSWPLLYQLTAAFTLVNLLALLTNLSPAIAVVNAIVVSALLALITHWFLRRRGFGDRFAQTCTALMSTGALLGLAGLWPIMGLQPFFEALRALPPDAKPEQFPQPPMAPTLIYLVIGTWQMVVIGHIYRHALEVTLGKGLLLAMVYQLALLLAVQVVNAF